MKTINNNIEFNTGFLLFFFGYYFLVIFLIMISRGQYIPAHTAESLYLGLEMQLGYAKHPPLHAVIPYMFWNLFNYSYYSLYIFTAALLTFGIINSYFLSKEILTKQKAIIATLIYSGVLAINFSQLKINANTILFPIYPLIVLFFYKAIKTQKCYYWMFFGVFAALGMLGKYSTLVLLFCCFLGSVFTQEGRCSYKKLGIYIGLLTFLIVFGSHVIWLFFHYQPALNYFSNNALQARNIPAQLYLGMLGTTSIAILYWLSFVVNWKKPFVTVCMNFEARFLLFCCIVPIMIIMLLPILGIHTKANWLSAFYFGIGTVLVYFSRIDLSQGLKIKRNVIYVLFTYTLLGLLCIFGINMSGYSDKYEFNRVSEFLYDNWHKNFNTNPSYICHSGDLEAIAAIKLMNDIYKKTKVKHKIHLILDCKFDNRPEIDLNDVREKGLITFSDKDADIAKQIFDRDPIYNQTLQLKEYPKLKSSKLINMTIKFYA